ncbi:MAG: hypothetical protein WA941_03385 [Nitrososphaeraceae archaeon]
MVGVILTPSAVFAVVTMTMDLEKSGDDEYSIENIELNETANVNGIYPFCNYVNPCSFEWDEDAEFRPNTVSPGYVVTGELTNSYESVDGGTNSEFYQISIDLDRMSSGERDGVVQEDIFGDMSLSGGGFLGSLTTKGSWTAFGNINFTDDGDNARLLIKAF